MTQTPPIPAEWSPHKALWLGFPSHAELWQDDLPQAQAEVAALARTLAGVGREHVKLVVMGPGAEAAAHKLLAGTDNITILQAKFGDIWLRDTGPIFTTTEAHCFEFNGWGGKYQLEHDDSIGAWMAHQAGQVPLCHDVILEGGALDHNGEGVILTTRQCLLNPNRNPGITEAQWEGLLASTLGARRVVWLDDGLVNDHTDGHVDNLARFVGPGRVAVPAASGDDDPHAAVYAAAQSRLRDAGFEVIEIPSPGRIEVDGEIVPASHMNFIIANGAVIMPTYEDTYAPQALEVLEATFPDRAVMGLPSLAILTGGGSFHCITQQEPA